MANKRASQKTANVVEPKLSDCRQTKLSDCRQTKLSDCRQTKLEDNAQRSVDNAQRATDYGKGPITITMTIGTRNEMCNGNKELHGKLTLNGHRMWCVETGGNHYFCIAQPHIEYNDVWTYVGGVAKQREINRELLKSYAPAVENNAQRSVDNDSLTTDNARRSVDNDSLTILSKVAIVEPIEHIGIETEESECADEETY